MCYSEFNCPPRGERADWILSGARGDWRWTRRFEFKTPTGQEAEWQAVSDGSGVRGWGVKDRKNVGNSLDKAWGDREMVAADKAGRALHADAFSRRLWEAQSKSRRGRYSLAQSRSDRNRGESGHNGKRSRNRGLSAGIGPQRRKKNRRLGFLLGEK